MSPRFQALRRWLLLRLINFWPPYLASGIRIRQMHLAEGFAEVQMKLHWWNRNYVGTHYGGSLYSMCDPFYMLILMAKLGRDFVVWDKSATIRFRRPGRGTVRARFEVTSNEVERIREAAVRDGVTEPVFVATVTDGEAQVVAEVEKVLHVRYSGSPRT